MVDCYIHGMSVVCPLKYVDDIIWVLLLFIRTCCFVHLTARVELVILIILFNRMWLSVWHVSQVWVNIMITAYNITYILFNLARQSDTYHTTATVALRGIRLNLNMQARMVMVYCTLAFCREHER